MEVTIVLLGWMFSMVKGALMKFKVIHFFSRLVDLVKW